MEPYIEKWKELGLTFDGIATGFLGSERQIEIVKDMIAAFRTPGTKVLVDPLWEITESPMRPTRRPCAAGCGSWLPWPTY